MAVLGELAISLDSPSFRLGWRHDMARLNRHAAPVPWKLCVQRARLVPRWGSRLPLLMRHAPLRSLLLVLGLSGARLLAQPVSPELTLELGPENRGAGLAVPSLSDGANEPVTIAGEPARRVAGKGASYLYVVLKDPAYAQGRRDLYVTFELADDLFARVSVQYDKEAATPDLQTKYTTVDSAVFLTGAGGWRKATFFLPNARLGHGENQGADLRLMGPGVAVRRVTVSGTRPAGFAEEKVDAASLRALEVHRPPGMEFTLGNDATAADAAVYRAIGATSVESYVTWAGVEPRENEWDWSKWDRQVALLKSAHLKWVPFLIAGPAYATPLWFHNGAHSHYFRCLEHGAESKVQSIFNPDLPPYVERFLRAFAEHYRDSEVIESVLLGVSGVFGESIYPAGNEGGWTAQLTGTYHNHAAWWAGDVYAEAAFRAAMTKKYAGVTALNQAWGTKLASFAEVAPFLPEKAASDRARADFVEWYQQAMTDWAARWVSLARRALPKTEIYLCTGGDGNPQLGADFTAQAKAIAGAGAGIRVTNEGSDYARNFSVTREVATATKQYGTFCGFEPASKVNEKGVVARLYNAAASGARQLHDYAPNLMTNAAALRNLRQFAPQLAPQKAQVPLALYLSRESWAQDAGRIARLYEISRAVRDLADHDYLAAQSVQDGGLKRYRAALLTESPVLEPASAAALEQWVTEGGLLFAATRQGEETGTRLDDQAAWRKRMFQPVADTAALLTRTLEGDAPAHWVLKIGSEGDDEWLFGKWFGRERGAEWASLPGAQKRWTGAKAGIFLPVGSRGECQLHLSCYVPPYAITKGPGEIRVNGKTVAHTTGIGLQETTVSLTREILGANPIAQLEITVGSWKPSDHHQPDTRDLGMAVREVEVYQTDSQQALPARASLQLKLDSQVLATLLRPVGKGYTVLLPGLAESPAVLSNVLAPLLAETGTYLPGQAPIAPGDGRVDGRYSTQVEGKLLWYDSKAGTIR